MKKSVTKVVEVKPQPKVVDISKESNRKLHPHVQEALRAIEAERSGNEPLAWSDFSSHNKK